MGLDLSALKKEAKKMETGGDVFYVKKMKSDTEASIRVMPPGPEMNGIYYVKTEGYWINGKRYLSPTTFGDDCEIEDEIAKALESGDAGVIDLCNKINNNKPERKDYDYRFLGLVFTNDDCDKIDGDKAKVVICGATIIEGINKFALHKKYQPDITSRVDGFNMFLSKEGKGLDTTYGVIADTGKTEQDPKLYEAKNMPDLMAEVKKFLGTAEYRRAVIREWLYGEEMPEDVKANAFKKPTTDSVESKEDEFIEEKPKKKVKKETTKAKKEEPAEEKSEKKGRGSLMDELDDVD